MRRIHLRSVAVGLAAIRPLNQQTFARGIETFFGCSGFGRYQAVETHRHRLGPCRRLVSVGLAAIRPLKLTVLDSV